MQKDINVLYLSYDGLTDPLGQSQVLSYLTKLSDKGCNITVLTFDKPDVYQSNKLEVQQIVDAHNIKWVSLSYTKSPQILSTYIDLRKGWQVIRKLFSETSFDIVHCRGYITAILGLRCKKKFNTKFIFDMRGWWPDEKKESGLWGLPIFIPVYKYFKHLEKRFFVESDYTISLTEAGKKEIVTLGYKSSDKICVIPTCVNFNLFKAFNGDVREQLRNKLNIPINSPVLVYSGSLGGNYANDKIFKLFKFFKKLFNYGVLLILTKADKKYVEYEAKKIEVSIKDIRVLPVDFSDMSSYLMVGDIGIVLYNPTYSAIGRSPTKLGEYWASGMTAISTAGIGDLDYLNNRFPEGLEIIDKFNEKHITRALKKAMLNSNNKDKLRMDAVEYYNLEKGVNNYLRIYQHLVLYNN